MPYSVTTKLTSARRVASPAPALKSGNDARDGPPFGRGRQGDDGKAALGQGCAANEVGLVARAAEKLPSHGVRTDLAGQIDLECARNGNEIVVLADYPGIVNEIRGVPK